MRFIVDTHAWLWWHSEPVKLGSEALRLMKDGRNELILSVVSAWEIAIKYATGKLLLPEPAKPFVLARLKGISILDISLAHTLECSGLPTHHKDPFDRMLIAQARVERIPILTADPAFRKYSVKVLAAT